MRTAVIELDGKKLFVLNGLQPAEGDKTRGRSKVFDELIEATRKNPDALAFGRTAGRWVAAA